MEKFEIKINIGAIPPRTRTRVNLNGQGKRVYSCIDCKFSTENLDAMLNHQENLDWKHKIKRFFG